VPHNPFDHVLFAPTALRAGAVLAAAILLILVLERGRPRPDSPLFQRLSSWAVMAPVFTAAVLTGGVVALALVVFMAVQALREYAGLVRLAPVYNGLLIAYGVFGLGVTAWWGQRFFLFLPLGFFALAALVPLVRLAPGRDESRTPYGELLHLAAMVLGYLWIPMFLSYFVLIQRTEAEGVGILLLLGFAVALSDVFAFTVGKLLRGPRLAAGVSPNKTWAGAAGNLAGAYVGFWIMGFATPDEWSAATRIVLPAVVALAALYGDLIESLVKRGFGVKDAGELLPGFGGLLDRIDSLLVALPLGYYAMKVLQHYTA
jgi:phosphatidate cytidylyltransferase